MRKLMMALGTAGLLAGCGDNKFHRDFVESCTASAVKSGVTQDVAEQVCACASDEVKKRYSEREKMSLKEAQLRPIMQECAKSLG